MKKTRQKKKNILISDCDNLLGLITKSIVCFVALFTLAFNVLITANYAQQKSETPKQKDVTHIINTDLVTLYVAVTDRNGRNVTGLNKNQFSLSDNNLKQEISFFSDEDTPASIGLVFDLSGSMGENKISTARESVKQLMLSTHTDDDFFLIGFNNRAQLLTDWTHDTEAIINKVVSMKPDGKTSFYDALYLAVEKASHANHKKRAVIVISDGMDNNSRFTFKELRRVAEESDVLVYAIGIAGTGSIKMRDYGLETLEKLSKVTGGKAFFPRSNEDIAEAFDRIALDIRSLYSIGFYPKDFTPDGKWHRLKVTLSTSKGSPKLIVRHREGYYALGNSSKQK